MKDMHGLLTALKVEKVGKRKWYQLQKYRLVQGLLYIPRCNVMIHVPAGFVTNFATWIKPRGKYDVASVIHDYLYSVKAGRKYADRVFKEAMKRGKCSKDRIRLMYYGVRCFGWYSYYISPLLRKNK